MADASRELVGSDIAAAVSFESNPRFIKARFQDYEGSRDQRIHCRFQACSLPTIEVARKQRVLETSPESGRIFGINWNFERSFQIEAIELRGTSREFLDQRSNQAQEFLLLWSVASRDETGSDLNVRDLST
jgi:hypothetical protein